MRVWERDYSWLKTTKELCHQNGIEPQRLWNAHGTAAAGIGKSEMASESDTDGNIDANARKVVKVGNIYCPHCLV